MSSEKRLMLKVMRELRDKIAKALDESSADQETIAAWMDNYAKLCYMVLNGEWLENET